MMFGDEFGPKPVRSEKHKLRHVLYGILVCTGMAHLILTTFEVPNLGLFSNIRIFIVGAIYTGLGLAVKYSHEKYVNISAIACALGMLSGITEYAISGSHFLATTLLLFDLMVIYYVFRYWSAKGDPVIADSESSKDGLTSAS